MPIVEVSADDVTNTLNVSNDLAAGLHLMWKFLRRYDLTQQIDHIRIIIDGSDIRSFDAFGGVAQIDNTTVGYSVRELSSWNSGQTWENYIRTFIPRWTIPRKRSFSLLLYYHDRNIYGLYIFRNLDFLQGMITMLQWLNINPNIYIKYIVANGQQMAINNITMT